MAEQHPTNDMFDVLASIRRLVSEERTAPQRIEPLPPTAPVSTAPAPAVAAVEVAAASVSETDAGARLTFARSESRFVLTPALRVADEDGAVQPAAAPAAEAQSAPPAPEEFIAPQAPHAATAPVSETAAETASDFTHAAPSRLTQDLDALDQRAASLEETIAELEAAVADISSEFEPDGGELVDIVAEYFPDEGEAPAPLLSDFAPDADENAPEPHPSFAQVRDLPLSQGPLVFTRDPSPAETEALAEAQPSVVRPHGIMAGFDAMSSAPDDALDLPVTGEALIPAVLPPRAPQDEAAGWPERRGSPFGGNARLEKTVHQTVDEDAPEPEADEAPAPRSRLQILRPEMAETAVTESLTPELEEDVSEPDSELEAGDLAEPEMARVPAEPDRSALAAEPLAAATGAEDEPLPPLFDPLADADYDVDALRDIVAELVRDELRGALGERITRNIRALVRAEMKRILAEEA
jgi:hypothetical protein